MFGAKPNPNPRAFQGSPWLKDLSLTYYEPHLTTQYKMAITNTILRMHSKLTHNLFCGESVAMWIQQLLCARLSSFTHHCWKLRCSLCLLLTG